MIRFLLHLYPAEWRKEYGEEFADVLASRPLTLRAAANVLWGAGWQRLIYAPTWLPGGMFCFLFFMQADWTQPRAMLYAEFLGLLATGVWGAARKRGSFAAGVSATATAMVVGFLPQAVQVFVQHVTSFSFTILGHVFSGPLRIHRVHHSSERLDWLAAARVHPLETVWTRTISVLPLFLLGFSPKLTAVLAGFIAIYPIFIHSNVRWGYGWIGYMVASPAFHRWHHSADAEAINKNYSGLLPLYDFLFGTAHFPKSGKPERYGLAGEEAPESFTRQLLWPFRA